LANHSLVLRPAKGTGGSGVGSVQAGKFFGCRGNFSQDSIDRANKRGGDHLFCTGIGGRG
jgi:hypothetical protein